ncbi:MAG: hypothetical protein QW639_04630 [Candidatus Bathyarchaeia archaeon]
MPRWRSEEIDLLKAKYTTMTAKQLSLILNKSEVAIQKKAETLGIKKQPRYREPKCRVCGVSLTDENWYPSTKRVGRHICKLCEYKKNKEWRRNAKPAEKGKCCVCGVELTDENWPQWRRKVHNYICRDCEKRRIKHLYYLKYRDKRRLTEIVTKVNGSSTKIQTIKRPYPGKCELCGKEERALSYHHWDDTHPYWGIWVCWLCHCLIDGFDHRGIKILEKYTHLKSEIEQTWNPVK